MQGALQPLFQSHIIDDLFAASGLSQILVERISNFNGIPLVGEFTVKNLKAIRNKVNIINQITVELLQSL